MLAAGATAAAGVLTSPGAVAGDANAGRAKSQTCMVCHGPLGVSSRPDAPHIAGHPAMYTAAQLRAYRSGARKNELMNVIAKPLTDEDIANLAAWYESVRVEATAPP